jgi:hypothetical protein
MPPQPEKSEIIFFEDMRFQAFSRRRPTGNDDGPAAADQLAICGLRFMVYGLWFMVSCRRFLRIKAAVPGRLKPTGGRR